MVLGRMPQGSRPHRLLGLSLPPLAALRVDRTVLAAARKHRAVATARDLQGCGSVEDATIRMLMRLHVWG